MCVCMYLIKISLNWDNTSKQRLEFFFGSHIQACEEDAQNQKFNPSGKNGMTLQYQTQKKTHKMLQ